MGPCEVLCLTLSRFSATTRILSKVVTLISGSSVMSFFFLLSGFHYTCSEHVFKVYSSISQFYIYSWAQNKFVKLPLPLIKNTRLVFGNSESIHAPLEAEIPVDLFSSSLIHGTAQVWTGAHPKVTQTSVASSLLRCFWTQSWFCHFNLSTPWQISAGVSSQCHYLELSSDTFW